MKNVLITGGSAGVGLALVKKFLSQGYTIFAVSRNPRSLSSIDNENLRYIQADITSEADRNKIISSLLNNNVSELSITIMLRMDILKHLQILQLLNSEHILKQISFPPSNYPNHFCLNSELI